MKKNWDSEIAELEKHFEKIKIPKKPIKMGCSTIINCSLFIESHFANIKNNNGNDTFHPFLNRLIELKKILK